jgi:hypothetical protein
MGRNLGCDFRIGLGEVCDLLDRDIDGIAVGKPLDLFERALIVSLRMRVEPIGLDNQQRRSTVVANVVDRLRRRFVQGPEVPRVGLEDASAKCLGAGADVSGDRHHCGVDWL